MPRTRSLFRFRLYVLLLLITALAVVLSVLFHREPLSLENVESIGVTREIAEDIWEIVWSPDRSRLALVRWEQPVEVRESVTLWPIKTFGEGKQIIHFAFSTDPNVVAFCENSTVVEVVDLSTEHSLKLETGNHQPRMDFNPSGTLLVTGGYGNAAKVWDARSGELVLQLAMGGTEGGLRGVFSPDGRIIAVGNRNSTTRLFDVQTGELLHELHGRSTLHELPKRMTHELAFHPSGKTLAVAYVDGSIGLWDVSTGELIEMRETNAEEIFRVDWSPQGDMLVSAGLNGDICIWKSDDLSLITALPAPEWVIGAKFSPDGTRLITCGGSRVRGKKRSLKVWAVAPLATKPDDG